MKNALVQISKWMFKHELISSCVLALILGLVIGGISSVLYWLLV